MDFDISIKKKHGIFYTPKFLVDYAHERITKILDNDWRNDFVVWDNCAGDCALTRDYDFCELYISTLLEEELQEGLKYNENAVHFQFDFLNDEIPSPEVSRSGNTITLINNFGRGNMY